MTPLPLLCDHAAGTSIWRSAAEVIRPHLLPDGLRRRDAGAGGEHRDGHQADNGRAPATASRWLSMTTPGLRS